MEQNKLNPCWRKDGSDYICDLPELPKAIYISYYFGGHYKISVRSWFPFKMNEYEAKYSDPMEAIRYAEGVILKFISSFLNATDTNDQLKQIQ